MGRSLLIVSSLLLSFTFVGCCKDQPNESSATLDEQMLGSFEVRINRQIDRATDPLKTNPSEGKFYTDLLANTAKSLRDCQRTHLTNIANADTHAFKRTRIVQTSAEVAEATVDFEMGPMENTARPLDVAINGDGMFAVMKDNSVAYTRSGNLFINKDGDLVVGMKDGPRILPVITLPANTTDISIAQDGSIEASVAGSITPTPVGRLELARFANPQGLRPISGNLFLKTKESGEPITTLPGENGAGEIQQSFLEGSNVDLIKERVQLIRVERQLELIDRLLARYEQNPPALSSGN